MIHAILSLKSIQFNTLYLYIVTTFNKDDNETNNVYCFVRYLDVITSPLEL